MARYVYGSSPHIPACLRGKLTAPSTRTRARLEGKAPLPYWPLKTEWRQCPTMPEFYVSPQGDVFLDDGRRSGYLVVQQERRRATFKHGAFRVSIRRLLDETWG